MEIQSKNTQICRLCLETEMDNGGFLVEIFSSLINEPGKMNMSEKIRALFGLKIVPNDGLPQIICHKCLVLTENCMDFRDKCLKNDEKLRLIFKVNVIAEEPQELHVQETVPEPPIESEVVEEEEEEVITLNPNKLYESSDDSEAESPQIERVIEPHQVQTTLVPNNISTAQATAPPPAVPIDTSKKEIFHCKFCDVVFSDLLTCSSHEQKNHDSQYPYECVTCSFKTDQHPTLIFHVKQTHNTEKPFLCTQCSKSFIRRSDLKKHTFVHAGIRLYSCDICKKSFTRNTNLTKHKRTHSDKMKTWKCKLCPRAFFTNSELSRHVEVHMDRNSFNCKHCNQAFARRDLLELHQKTHFESKPVMKQEPMTQPPVASSNQPQPIVFYNQPPEHSIQAHAPMNFYTESISYNSSTANGGALQPVQPKKEYPIMNQLLTGLNMNHGGHSLLQPVKPFVCGICSNAFFKKKELDRHVMTIHTNIKQFKCEQCSKEFNRKDKLLRHEKIHSMPGVFNCSLCPAVFVRQQMLELHSKVHQISNGDQLGNHLAAVQLAVSNNGFPTINSAVHASALPQMTHELIQPSMHEQQATNYPMNLSISKNSDSEPMNLSNDKLEPSIPTIKFEPTTKMSIDSDEERDDRLQIVEEPMVIKKSPSMLNLLKTPPEVEQSNLSSTFSSNDVKRMFDEPEVKNINDISFSMTSRITELDKMEPLKDLPMEILNND